MGMQDNPLVGEYTKGISKGPEYFANLQRRAAREKEPLRPIALDLANPLFAMIKAPVAPLALGKNNIGKTVTKKFCANSPVDKSVDNCVDNFFPLPKKQAKWRKLNAGLAELATAMRLSSR